MLRQSTNTPIQIGPMLTTSGTLNTSLVISSGFLRLSKNGGVFGPQHSNVTFTHNESGYYSGVLDTTDTDTYGTLQIALNISGALPYFNTYIVQSQNVYDNPSLVTPTGIYSVTVSGLTPASLAQIVSSGSAASWSADSVLVTATGLSPAVISQIIASGNLANWSADSNPVTVSGISPEALSQIIASGNAESWNIAQIDVNSIVSGIWNHSIDVATAEEALKYVLAYTAGNVSRSGSTYTYKSFNGTSDRLVIIGSNDGRTVTKE